MAGAGAGKTETMAARVVWLVANGLVRPEQVLGRSGIEIFQALMDGELPMAPIAIPTVAVAMAGASLTPSPTMATLVSARSFLIASTLSSGMRSPHASSMPTSLAIASAARW